MRLDFEILELRTRHAFHIARMASLPTRRSVWIRIQDDNGNEGWGEAPTTTPYYGETADTAAAILPRLGEAMAEAAESSSSSPDAPAFLLERLERAAADAVGYNPATHAGISAALHDLVGKRLGMPVWKLWGLDPARAPVSSFTIGIDSPEVMRERVREAAAYPVLKIKIGTERDEEILSVVREEAPDARLLVDANTAWTAREAVARLPMLEEYRVELLEQPLKAEDDAGWVVLRGRSNIPVVADESCRTSADVARLAGRVDGINIKLAKCGSLREAVRMVHVARAHGMTVMLGCMVQSTLGIAAAVQLAPLVDHADLDGAALLADDPFAGPGLEADGSVRFNHEPGLGVEQK